MSDQEQPLPREPAQATRGCISDAVDWLLEQYADILDRYHPTAAGDVE